MVTKPIFNAVKVKIKNSLLLNRIYKTYQILCLRYFFVLKDTLFNDLMIIIVTVVIDDLHLTFRYSHSQLPQKFLKKKIFLILQVIF